MAKANINNWKEAILDLFPDATFVDTDWGVRAMVFCATDYGNDIVTVGRWVPARRKAYVYPKALEK